MAKILMDVYWEFNATCVGEELQVHTESQFVSVRHLISNDPEEETQLTLESVLVASRKSIKHAFGWVLSEIRHHIFWRREPTFHENPN
jgi:hypothetical protein